MSKARLITIALISCLSLMTDLRASMSPTLAQQPADKKPPAAAQTPSDQDEAAEQDEETPPAKKKFTPAQSLNEALYLSTREDRNTTAYLDQAKNMLDAAGADAKATDAQKRTPLHWAVIGAMYADKKQASSYLDLAELLIAQGADVNAEDYYGNTPLDYQELSSAQQMMELLLEADGTARNELVRLEELLSSILAAAKAGDVAKVQAELLSDLPLGIVIPIKLTTQVSSNKSRAGDPLQAVVAAPVSVDDRVMIAPGTKLEGTVLYAGKSPNRFERSLLVLGFSNLVYSSEKTVRLSLRLTAVDNARETIEMGRIIGVSFPNNALSQKKVTWGRRLIGMAAPGLGYAIEASTMVYNKKFNREIQYSPGTDVTLRVLIPAKLNAAPDLKGWSTFSPTDELVKLVGAQPHRVDTKDGKPVDVTNVMLIGTQSEVDDAFRSAGWFDAAGLNASSGLKTFGAVMFKQGYDRAPFSDLYLSGRAPDLTLQKQLNTFAKRHHVRIWKVGSYQGKDVWVGAGTHDIGMGVDRKGVKPHWYHTVDTRVDGERDKIMNDLMFTGKVKAYSMVDRPQMPKKNLTPAGNSRDTDGRMLVLELN